MNDTKRFELVRVSRICAIWGSAVATLIFGLGFMADTQLMYSLMNSMKLKVMDIGVLLYVCLFVVVFAGYAISATRRWEVSGSMLVFAMVVFIYAWCRVQLNLYPGPYLLALAIPALCHVVAVSAESEPLITVEPSGESTPATLIPAVA